MFGNGKTALKVSLGRYTTYAIAAVDIPANNQANSTTRTWNDANGNYVPDCDLRNPAAKGECGPWSDLSFGQFGRAARAVRPMRSAVSTVRTTTGRASVSLQHELRPNVALNVGYFRTWYGDFLATDNAGADGSGLRSVLRHRAEGHAAARWRRESDLRVCTTSSQRCLAASTISSHRRRIYGGQSEVYNGFDVDAGRPIREWRADRRPA